MVRNTTAAAASAIVLSASQTKFAETQITAFAKDQESAKGAMSNMSSHLLELGKRAEKDGGKEKRQELYEALCKHAETSYKESHLGKDNKPRAIKDMLPFWPVAKSQVKAAIIAGLELKGFKTVYELVEATPKVKRTARTTDGTKDTGDDEGTVSMPKGEEGDALQKAYVRLNRTLKAIVAQHPELIGATAKSINQLCDSLEEMAHLEEQNPNADEGSGIPSEQAA